LRLPRKCYDKFEIKSGQSEQNRKVVYADHHESEEGNLRRRRSPKKEIIDIRKLVQVGPYGCIKAVRPYRSKELLELLGGVMYSEIDLRKPPFRGAFSIPK
jgi:hypothetical protein